MNYNNKQLVGAIIVAGWDKQNGGQVYSCPIGGTIVQEAWTTDGSGSTYIWGNLDAAYRDDMSRDDAEAFVKDSVALAMARDGSSGGIIRMITLAGDGPQSQYLQGPDIPLFQDDLPFVSENGGVVVG
jgi:20S proteasome subunit beta 1